jgi:hypothetical protein
MNIKELSVSEKKVILNNAAVVLKSEFIGLDNIIDELSDSILPWWLFPTIQHRPLIINLWGMTGSGKTALVKRLCELLQYESMLMRFDMGEFGNSSSFLKYTLTRQLSQFHEECPVILLDEFQFAKTKDETGKEVNNYNLRIIWDLLDSGQLIYEPDGLGYYSTRAKRVMMLLEQLEKRGAKIKDGIVTHLASEVNDAFTNYMFGYDVEDRSEGKMPFQTNEILISDRFCTGIYEMNQTLHDGYQGVAEVMKTFNSLKEIIDYIYAIFEKEMAFKTMDLSKSLIFVVGNLDEAFFMSNNINPDIDADEFKRHTEKITIADIKSALQCRFRNEQIARLGNTHLIYHAFSNKNFEDLIKVHLQKVADMTEDKFGLKVEFTKKINKLLYSEGVFPTQGVRPVISTIRNMIDSNIAKVVLHLKETSPIAKNILWDIKKDFYEIEFYENETLLSTLKIPVLQKINSLRISTKNDLQAIVAVHETGHTLAAMFLAKVVPEYVITKTVDNGSQGFAYIILPEEIHTYRLLLDQIKISLGGYVAESFIFGKENNTTGVSEDLVKATNIAHQILRDYGMGGLPVKYHIHEYGGNPYQFTYDKSQEEQALHIVELCLRDVENCLAEHKSLLIDIAKHLSNNSRIDKKELIKLCDEYCTKSGKEPMKFVTKDTYYDFRDRLFAM